MNKICLSDICEVASGQSAPQERDSFSNEGHPFIRAGSLESLIKGQSNTEFITCAVGKKLRLRLFPKKTILFAKSGMSAKIGRVYKLSEPSYVVSHLAAIIPDVKKIDPDWLKRWFEFHPPSRLIPNEAYPSIKLLEISNLMLNIVSLENQKKISILLDTADSLRQKRKEQLDLLNDYIKSVFLEMFGNPLTNNKNIRQRKIGDLGEVITGNTPSRQKKEYYGNFIEWIKSDNINTPKFILTKAEEFLSEVGAKLGRIVSKGSVLVTCIAGSPECIGNCAIADRKVAFNQQINAFVPGNEINTEFFFTQLHICKRLVQQASTESMKGMVSKGRFSEIKILAPSLEQQIDFVMIFNSVVKMREKMRTSLDEMDTYFNALMQRYFR